MSAVFTDDETAASWRAELRACLVLAWPLALTNAIEMAINVTNLAFIGRLGTDAVAASTLALALYNTVLLFGIGVTAAVAALIAPVFGAERDAGPAVRRIVQQGLWGAALLSVPASAVLWEAEPLLILAGQERELAKTAAAYLHVMQWSLFPVLAYLVLRSTLATLGSPRWAVLTGLGAVALNALLNAVLIGGAGPIPALGLAGSALATLLTNVSLGTALLLVSALDLQLRPWRLAADVLRPRWRGFAAFWRLGLPIGISLTLEVGMFTAAAALIGPFGTAALAAHAIALQVASCTFMVPLGVAQAATIRIGRAWGRGDRTGVQRAGWTALGIQAAAMALSALGLVAAARPITALSWTSVIPPTPPAQPWP